MYEIAIGIPKVPKITAIRTAKMIVNIERIRYWTLMKEYAPSSTKALTSFILSLPSSAFMTSR